MSALDVVSLADAKIWMRVEYDAEDSLIQGLIEGTVDDAQKFIQRQLFEVVVGGVTVQSDYPGGVPSAVSNAIKQYVSAKYKSRDGLEIDLSKAMTDFKNALGPYRKNLWGTSALTTDESSSV